jgi:hypothetical protein
MISCLFEEAIYGAQEKVARLFYGGQKFKLLNISFGSPDEHMTVVKLSSKLGR